MVVDCGDKSNENKGRIDLGEFELNIGNNTEYLDRTDVWEIPPNGTASFKFTIEDTYVDVTDCTGKNTKARISEASLTVEFINPDSSLSQSITQEIKFN